MQQFVSWTLKEKEQDDKQATDPLLQMSALQELISLPLSIPSGESGLRDRNVTTSALAFQMGWHILLENYLQVGQQSHSKLQALLDKSTPELP